MAESVSHISQRTGNLSNDEFNQGLDTLEGVSGATIDISRRAVIYEFVKHIKDGRWRRLIRLFCEQATTVHRGTNIAGALLRLHKATPYKAGSWAESESSEECLACPLCDGGGVITLRRASLGDVVTHCFRCPHEHTKARYKGLFPPLARALPDWERYMVRRGFVFVGDEPGADEVVFECDEQDGMLMLPFREHAPEPKIDLEGESNADDKPPF